MNIKDKIKKIEFYNPGVTRYLTLSDTDIEEILEVIRKEIETAEPVKRGSWIMHPDWINRSKLIESLKK